jgi:hypothetical protein
MQAIACNPLSVSRLSMRIGPSMFGLVSGGFMRKKVISAGKMLAD